MPAIPDLSNDKASTGSGAQCPPGWHPMKVASVEERTNDKGNTTHFVTFEALDLPGHSAKDSFTIAGQCNTAVGRERYKGLLTCLGFTGFAGLDTAHLIGRACKVLVIDEPWTGRDGTQKSSAKASAYEKLAAGAVTTQKPVAAPVAAAGDPQAPF